MVVLFFFPVHTIERYISHSLDSFEFSSIDSFREKNFKRKKQDHFFDDLIGAKTKFKRSGSTRDISNEISRWITNNVFWIVRSWEELLSGKTS